MAKKTGKKAAAGKRVGRPPKTEAKVKKSKKSSSKTAEEPKKKRKVSASVVDEPKKKGKGSGLSLADWKGADDWVDGQREAFAKETLTDVGKFDEGETTFFLCPPYFMKEGEKTAIIHCRMHWIGLPAPLLHPSRNPIMSNPRLAKYLKQNNITSDPVTDALQSFTQDELKAKGVRVSQSKWLMNIVPIKFKGSARQKKASILEPEIVTIEAGWQIMEDVQKYIEQWGNPSHPNHARLFVVTRTGTQRNTKYKVDMDPTTLQKPWDLEESKLGRRVIECVREGLGIEGGPHDPYAIIGNRIRTQSEVTAAIAAIGLGEEDEGPKRSSRRREIPAEEVEDAFGEMDEVEVDEEEEEAPPKKKGKKAKPVVEEIEDDDDDEEEAEDDDDDEEEESEDEESDDDDDEEEESEDEESDDDDDEEDEESDDDDDEEEEEGDDDDPDFDEDESEEEGDDEEEEGDDDDEFDDLIDSDDADEDEDEEEEEAPPKRGRGRPKGSKNKPKDAKAAKAKKKGKR